MKHIVLFSTGLASAITLDMVQKMHGRDNTIALLTDTRWEDIDNYRFTDQAIKHLNANLVYTSEGRTPPEIWMQTGYLVGPTGSPCTRILKIEQTIKFVKAKKEPIALYFGIGANEAHRKYGLERRYKPLGVDCRFPLIDYPLGQQEMKNIVENGWKIRIPRMYDLGFSHANCGGRCVKAGKKHFIHLLNTWTERFNEIAEIEQNYRVLTGYDITILRVQKGGIKYRLPLTELKKTLEKEIALSETWEQDMPCECMM